MDLKEAILWKKEGTRIRCSLCNRRCLIADGMRGNCGVRENIKGKLYALTYGKPCSTAVDPIEKKPLHNFWPGSRALSIATVGCNFHCGFCQNWQISQAKPEAVPANFVPPKDIVAQALKEKCHGIAYTYTEPTIFFEYCTDIAKLAAKKGLYNVFVTNGYMTREMLEAAKWMDAANVDIKAFDETFYQDVCGGVKLKPVLDNVEWMREHKIHVELTTLLIPGLNDDPGQLKALAEWIVSVDPSMPLHFSRFHPEHQMLDKPITPETTLRSAYQIAKTAGVKYVYVGNIAGRLESTFCPKCNHLLIERSWYTLFKTDILKKGKAFACPECGQKQDIIGKILA